MSDMFTLFTDDLKYRAGTISILSAAFNEDPAFKWIIPKLIQRKRALPMIFSCIYDSHRRHGLISTSRGGEAVVLWRAPGKVHLEDPVTPAMLLQITRAFGLGIYRAARLGRAIHRHVPHGEGWLYIRYLGVRPDAQGADWGGRALREVIAQANERGVPTCLETNNPANVGLYEHFGYQTIEEWDVCPGGPHFWTMIRERD